MVVDVEAIPTRSPKAEGKVERKMDMAGKMIRP
jgi:hypothetical protein